MKILKTILFSMGAVQAIDMDALIAALKSNDTDALEKFNNQKVFIWVKKLTILGLKLTKNMSDNHFFISILIFLSTDNLDWIGQFSFIRVDFNQKKDDFRFFTKITQTKII